MFPGLYPTQLPQVFKLLLISLIIVCFPPLLAVADLEEDIIETSGCTDESASNYDSSASYDDGSCEYPEEGCTDLSASNYNPAAVIDDATCEYLGCTDESASNYSANANIDDGSCEYPEDGDYPDSVDTTAEDSVDTQTIQPLPDDLQESDDTDDGTVESLPLQIELDEVQDADYEAVTLPLQIELDESDDADYEAVTLPLQIELDETVDPDYEETTSPPQVELEESNDSADDVEGIQPQPIKLEEPDDLDVGNEDPAAILYPESHVGCTDSTAQNYDSTADYDDGSCMYLEEGCRDPGAENYNAAAVVDDGSCEYSGCTDESADNYDSGASYDDGSCVYADFDEEEVFVTADPDEDLREFVGEDEEDPPVFCQKGSVCIELKTINDRAVAPLMDDLGDNDPSNDMTIPAEAAEFDLIFTRNDLESVPNIVDLSFGSFVFPFLAVTVEGLGDLTSVEGYAESVQLRIDFNGKLATAARVRFVPKSNNGIRDKEYYYWAQYDYENVTSQTPGVTATVLPKADKFNFYISDFPLDLPEAEHPTLYIRQDGSNAEIVIRHTQGIFPSNELIVSVGLDGNRALYGKEGDFYLVIDGVEKASVSDLADRIRFETDNVTEVIIPIVAQKGSGQINTDGLPTHLGITLSILSPFNSRFQIDPAQDTAVFNTGFKVDCTQNMKVREGDDDSAYQNSSQQEKETADTWEDLPPVGLLDFAATCVITPPTISDCREGAGLIFSEIGSDGTSPEGSDLYYRLINPNVTTPSSGKTILPSHRYTLTKLLDIEPDADCSYPSFSVEVLGMPDVVPEGDNEGIEIVDASIEIDGIERSFQVRVQDPPWQVELVTDRARTGSALRTAAQIVCEKNDPTQHGAAIQYLEFVFSVPQMPVEMTRSCAGVANVTVDSHAEATVIAKRLGGLDLIAPRGELDRAVAESDIEAIRKIAYFAPDSRVKREALYRLLSLHMDRDDMEAIAVLRYMLRTDSMDRLFEDGYRNTFLKGVVAASRKDMFPEFDISKTKIEQHRESYYPTITLGGTEEDTAEWLENLEQGLTRP